MRAGIQIQAKHEKPKAPSFKGLVAASASSSEAKRKNRSSNTAHELSLRKMLWQNGLRYRINFKELPGKPDIVFRGAKVAVFCDGDFWHGRNWSTLSKKLATGSNPSYWIQKVHSNSERDLKNNRILSDLGWVVLRFWETDIQRHPNEIVSKIMLAVRKDYGSQQVVDKKLVTLPNPANRS